MCRTPSEPRHDLGGPLIGRILALGEKRHPIPSLTSIFAESSISQNNHEIDLIASAN
jgi:hypothetical protein